MSNHSEDRKETDLQRAVREHDRDMARLDRNTLSYEPSFRADTVSEDADIKLLSPRVCECGIVMDNGLSDTCAWCEDDDDGLDLEGYPPF